jgi:hypothetical protein
LPNDNDEQKKSAPNWYTFESVLCRRHRANHFIHL